MDSAPETVLITGASAGIGQSLAACFAGDQSHLILVARREEKLRQLARQLEERYGVEVTVVVKDLTVAGAAEEIRQVLDQRQMAVDVVVNNAGFGEVGTVAEISLERQLEMVQVNVTAVTHLTRLFLPGMIRRGRGGILNVGSTAAFQPGPGMAVYYASKAYVLAFTEALAEELRGTGVTATCLAPGPTYTEFGAVSGIESARLFRLGAMDAAAVARAGVRGFRRRRTIVIPGPLNQLGALSVRFVPRVVVRKIVRWLNT
ncbi:MAG: SDR family NAD(P)-dependent oxidoreductase [Planctomycetales bacterium]|nr:SDR family NAD(P)-dependent oxidoreductase [Planctomycetales bacterium]